MNYQEKADRLRQFSQELIAYKLGGEFADACEAAACELEHLGRQNEAMNKQLDTYAKADKIPVVHSYWEYDPDGVDWGIGAWVCHRCKQKNENLGHSENTNPRMWTGSVWCPQCGAKMDGDKNGD